MADTIDDKLTQLLTGVTALTTRIDAVEKERGETKTDAENVSKMLKDCAATMDSINKRLDSLEQHRKDEDALKTEREKNDLKKNDGETEEEKKKREAKERDDAEEAAKRGREDSARKDRERHDSQDTRIKDLERQLAAIAQHVSDAPTEDRAKFADVWNKAERLAQLHCDSQGAPKWSPGESLHAYTCRVFNKYKAHSPAWKDVDLSKVTEPSAFAVATSQIFNDAEAAATKPENVPSGEMRRIVDRSSGREIIKWVARNDDACWRQFTNVSLMVGKFRRPQQGVAA